MSRNRDISNGRQHKKEANQEPNALRKRIPDRELRVTARAPIHAGMPPLISYVGERYHNIGESNRQLERQVMRRNSWASTVSQVMNLPLLSRVFKYMQKKSAFITPVYQRMLDLPLLRLRRKPGSSFTRRKDAIANRQQHTISLRPDDLHSNMRLQNLSETGEGQQGEADEIHRQTTCDNYPVINSDLLSTKKRWEPAITAHDIPHAASPIIMPRHTRKIMAQHDQNVPTRPSHLTAKEQPARTVDETYNKTPDETYPMINSVLLSPPLTMRELAITAHDIPHAASPIIMPRHTRKIMAQHDQNVPIRPSHLTAKEQPVSRANEIPTVIKNVLSSPAAAMRLPDTDSESFYYAPPAYMPPSNKQIKHNREAEGGSEPISPHVGQSDTTVPAVHPSYEIREPDHTQAKATEGRLSEVDRQPHHKYRIRTLSPVLMPITQRTSHQLALSQQPEKLEPKSVLHSSPAWSGSPISGDALKRPSPSIPPMIAMYPSTTASSTLWPEALTDREGTEMLPRGISRQSVPQIRQARRQKPLVISRVELPGDKADAIYQTERMIGDNQSKDTLNLGTPKYGRIGLGFARERINKPLFYSQPLSVARSFIQLSPDHKRIHGMMTSPMQQFAKSIYDTNVSNKTGDYGFVLNREYISSYPDVKYTYQQAPELAKTSLLQKKAESNTAYRKEVLTDTSDIFPELTYSRKQNVPELPLAPISRIPEIQTRPAESEPQGVENNERAAKDEVENIARDVYHILKRRLARERERALGVI